jgi:hypothetical protein
MYGGNVSSDSEEETTMLPAITEKPMMKSYSAQPPPEGFIPQANEDGPVEEITSSDASSGIDSIHDRCSLGKWSKYHYRVTPNKYVISSPKYFAIWMYSCN